MKSKKVFVAMPSGSWFPYPDTMFALFHQIVPEWYELVFNMDSIVSRNLVHTARNILVRRFLSWDYDYLLRCDDDNPPSADVLKILLEADKDVCSALVPLRHGNYMLNLFDKWKNIVSIKDYPNLFEVENIWTGCVLLKRKVVSDVFEATKWRPYQFQVTDFVWNKKEDIKEMYLDQDKHEWWEDEYIHEKWVITKLPWETGEDLFFWLKAKELWYKFYADKRARCIHFRGKPEFLSVSNE